MTGYASAGSCATSRPRPTHRSRPCRTSALPVALGDEGLVGGNHLLDVGEQLPFPRDQGRLARAVVHSDRLLPLGMDLSELGRQGLKALLERVTSGMHAVVHLCPLHT